MVGNKTPLTPVKRMNVLSEKEIQERLYGFYHKSDMVGEPKPKEPQPQEPVAAAPTVATPSSPRFIPIVSPVPQKPFDSAQGRPIWIQRAGTEPQKEMLEGLKTNFTQAAAYLKKIPTRVFGIAAAVLIGLLIISQLFAFGLKKIQEMKSAPPKAVQVESVKKNTRTVSPERTQPTPETSVPTPAPATDASSVKLYTVQLALSDNVTASEGLIASLQSKGYEAYYRKVRGSRGNDLFQIFVGRYQSSSEAQSALKNLRADADFKNFDDSFVRVTQ